MAEISNTANGSYRFEVTVDHVLLFEQLQTLQDVFGIFSYLVFTESLPVVVLYDCV